MSFMLRTPRVGEIIKLCDGSPEEIRGKVGVVVRKGYTSNRLEVMVDSRVWHVNTDIVRVQVID